MQRNRIAVAKGSDIIVEVPFWDLPASVTMVSARMCIKNALDDDDAEAVATIDVTGDDVGNDSVQRAAFPRFHITKVDTALLTEGTEYFWAVRVLLSNGLELAPEAARGQIRCITRGVTTLP